MARTAAKPPPQTSAGEDWWAKNRATVERILADGKTAIPVGLAEVHMGWLALQHSVSVNQYKRTATEVSARKVEKSDGTIDWEPVNKTRPWDFTDELEYQVKQVYAKDPNKPRDLQHTAKSGPAKNFNPKSGDWAA